MKYEPEEVVALVRGNVARNDLASAENLEITERALVACPKSVELWCLRGDLIQISDDDGRYLLEDAEASYLKAAEIDPENPEAFESLGHYYDTVCDDPTRAEPQFRRAIELGAGKSACQALAEVHEQLES